MTPMSSSACWGSASDIEDTLLEIREQTICSVPETDMNNYRPHVLGEREDSLTDEQWRGETRANQERYE